jgi:hypothetical protein
MRTLCGEKISFLHTLRPLSVRNGRACCHTKEKRAENGADLQSLNFFTEKAKNGKIQIVSI